MDNEKNDQNIFIITIFHLFISIILFIYALTTLWYLHEMLSINDTIHYEMSIGTKFGYSIRSLLLLFHLQ